MDTDPQPHSEHLDEHPVEVMKPNPYPADRLVVQDSGSVTARPPKDRHMKLED